MDPKKTEISFLIVNFRSREYLPRSLASIQKLADFSGEVIVVNNDPEPLENLSSGSLAVRIIQAGKNLGFGSAVNLGARASQGHYLFLLNPDAEVLSGSFSKALQEFRSDPDLAILGSQIINPRGATQDWIAGEKITPWRIIQNNLGFNPNARLQKENTTLRVDWVSGGAMLIRKDFFQELGGFDENIFLYFEDIDLCRRARERGWEVAYFPQLVIRHLGGKSFKDKREQKKHYYQSQEYYFRKHFGRSAAILIRWLRMIFH